MIILQGSSHYIATYIVYTCAGPVRSKKWLVCCQLYHHSHVISDVRYIFFYFESTVLKSNISRDK